MNEKLVLRNLRVVWSPEWQAIDGGYFGGILGEHEIQVDDMPKPLAQAIRACVELVECRYAGASLSDKEKAELTRLATIQPTERADETT